MGHEAVVEERKLRAQITAKFLLGTLSPFCKKKGVEMEEKFNPEEIYDVITEVMENRVKLSQVEKIFQQ